LVPSSYQFLWAPVIDVGPRRRTWLVLVSFFGGICMAAAMFVDVKTHLRLFEILVVAGQGITGMVGSCNGGLMATTLPADKRGQASGWLNAANLGGSAIGGGFILYVARVMSARAAGIAVGIVIFVPSLAALFVEEAPRVKRAAGEVFGSMIRDVWGTLKTRTGIIGVLICLSPVSTAAMLNLFGAIAKDYNAPSQTVEFVNGYMGGLVTAVGSLVTGFVLDRFSKRAAYLLAGVFTAVCGLAMALAPVTPRAYVVGVLAYLLITGWCYAAFTAFVLEVIGRAGHSASTQYTLFTAAGNQAIAYVTWFNGKGYDWFAAHGRSPTAGMLFADAFANLAGVVVIAVVLLLVFKKKPVAAVEQEEAAAAA
jgi:MFS family permease